MLITFPFYADSWQVRNWTKPAWQSVKRVVNALELKLKHKLKLELELNTGRGIVVCVRLTNAIKIEYSKLNPTHNWLYQGVAISPAKTKENSIESLFFFFGVGKLFDHRKYNQTDNGFDTRRIHFKN